jgi:hypothetical protein
VAISSLRGEYMLQWHAPGTPSGCYGVAPIDQGMVSRYDVMIPDAKDITAGQTLRAATGRFALGPGLAPGILRGRVSLRDTEGPLIQAEDDAVIIPVGGFTVRVA